MSRDIERKILKQRANLSLSMTDIELLQETREKFSRRRYISTAYLQTVLQIPFMRASNILEELIAEGFAIPKENVFPRGVSLVNSKIKELR